MRGFSLHELHFVFGTQKSGRIIEGSDYSEGSHRVAIQAVLYVEKRPAALPILSIKRFALICPIPGAKREGYTANSFVVVHGCTNSIHHIDYTD